MGTNRDLKVDVFLRVRAHLVAEAELVLALLDGREDKVALPLVLPVHDDLAARSADFVVDIKRAAGLYLLMEISGLLEPGRPHEGPTAK